jgi:hypothetical protein
VPRRNAIGTARKVFVVLAWAFVLAVAIQFPILVLIAAVFGLMGRAVIGMTIGVFVLVFLQPLFAAPELDPHGLRPLHVLNVLIIAFPGYDLVQRGSSIARDVP